MGTPEKSKRTDDTSVSAASVLFGSKKYWGPIATIVLVILTYFLSQMFAAVLVAIYPALRGWNAGATDVWLRTPAGQFWTIVLIEAVVVGIVWGLLKIRGAGLKTIGLKKPKWMDITYALAGFAAYFVLYVIISSVAQKLFPSIDFDQKQQIGFETAREVPQLILVFVSLVIAPPIAEEILCRGFMYTNLKQKWTGPSWRGPVAGVLLVAALLRLAQRFNVSPTILVPVGLATAGLVYAHRWYPRIVATIITSILFAVAHLQFNGDGAPLLWVAAIDTFVLSLVLVFLREKTNSLSSPIMLHMLKNGLAFTLLFVIGVQ